MAEILVLADHSGGEVKKVTLELLTLARSLGEPSAVVVGAGAGSTVDALAEYGARRVYVAEDAELDRHPVAPAAEVLVQLVGPHSPAAVLIASTADGKEIAARLAVRIDSGLITDAVQVDADLTATQSIFGGSVIVKSRVTRGTPVITVRPNSTAPEAAAGPCEREDLSISLSDGASRAVITNRVEEKHDARPELAEAAVVVSGGRGVGGADGFKVIEALADALGGAVGASRAATDAGWYPHQYQVGQTGKTVSPQLYVAAGISGAIQHRAGMQTSKNIVVINKDPEAPIFEVADFGVVGDLFSVVPQLTEEVVKRK
ncbi:MAG: electron transfer flavoprotein subunit alpha/FixB family protein [Candidatus Nanopelagicales bacterium]|nr:electron transfer flavoprotein subunit alpha/FixB family protein [Candidatus Nanopelagicales bacterium]